MYRPDRIGPWPLCDIDATNVWTPTATMGTQSAYVANLEDVTEYTAARTRVFSVGNVAVGAAQSWCVGIKIAGGALTDSPNALLSVAGNIHYTQAENQGQVFAFIGRGADSSAAPAIIPTWFIPVTGVAEGTQNIFNLGFSTTIVLGDFGSSSTDLVTPLILCIGALNGLGSTVNMSFCQGSLSIHRYEADIDTFDPNR